MSPPDLLDSEGFSHQAMAERRPGIIGVSIKLNANTGPWSHWSGFDINAGGITGLATAEGTPGQPLPPQQMQVICDIC